MYLHFAGPESLSLSLTLSFFQFLSLSFYLSHQTHTTNFVTISL